MIKLDEFAFIKSIKQDDNNQSSLIKGIGDDAAIFRQSTKDIVTAVDTFVENVHFSQSINPFYIGYRGLAANISDLAAMGSTPAFYLVSIVIPKSYSDQQILKIYAGMKELAEHYRMDLIGGDTVSGNELSISITVIGYVDKGNARYRHEAKPGDVVFITGTLGDSQAGLHMLLNEGYYTDKNYFIKRHLMPSPRIEFSNELKGLDRVALNDISDGIANESEEIAYASGVSILLYDEKIPVSSTFHQFSEELQNKWKYFGGEDFELMGTVARKNWLFVKRAADKYNIQITEIGHVKYDDQNDQLVYLYKNGQTIQLKKQGYRHF